MERPCGHHLWLGVHFQAPRSGFQARFPSPPTPLAQAQAALLWGRALGLYSKTSRVLNEGRGGQETPQAACPPCASQDRGDRASCPHGHLLCSPSPTSTARIHSHPPGVQTDLPTTCKQKTVEESAGKQTQLLAPLTLLHALRK